MRTTIGNVLRTRFSIAALPVFAIASLLSFTLPAGADAGWFSKKNKDKPRKESVEKPPPKPKKKPMQAIFAPKRQEPVRAEPVTPGSRTEAWVSPANYRPDTPSLPGATAGRRPGQTRVFVLGDSQGLLPFGPALQRALVEADCEVLFHAVKNGTPYFWQGRWPSPVLTRVYETAATPEQCDRWKEVSMRPRSIADYVAGYDPDVFIFQAGTNFEEDLAGDYTAGIVGHIGEGLRQATAHGARVLWIGPPDARDDVRSAEFQDRAVATLRTALDSVSEAQGGDCFLDSRPLCPIPNDAPGDGEHPSNATGTAWGTAAGAWAVATIAHWRKEGSLRPTATSSEGTTVRLFTQRLEDRPAAAIPAFSAELELVAKSDPGDIATLPYTDAFSVFRYRVKNTAELQPRLAKFGVLPDDGGDPVIQVLHWAVHNDGSGPRATRVASREIGETCAMSLCPLSEHPLGEPLGTMTRFDDFNDFLAPVFVASDLLAERVY